MKYKTVNSEKLFEIIYHSGGFPKYPNDRLKQEIKYFDYKELDRFSNQMYFIAVNDNHIIGLLQLNVYSDINDVDKSISYLSVNKEFHGLGIASKLAENCFEYCGYGKLGTSGYSNDGFTKLKPLFNKLALKYHVEFHDRDGIEF